MARRVQAVYTPTHHTDEKSKVPHPQKCQMNQSLHKNFLLQKSPFIYPTIVTFSCCRRKQQQATFSRASALQCAGAGGGDGSGRTRPPSSLGGGDSDGGHSPPGNPWRQLVSSHMVTQLLFSWLVRCSVSTVNSPFCMHIL